MGEYRVGRFRSDNPHKLFPCCATHAGKASEGHQQCLSAFWTYSSNTVQLGSQITARARLPVERDGEPVRFVANLADQQECGTVVCQRDRVGAITSKKQFLLLCQSGRDEAAEAKFFERGVRRRELSLSTVDQHEVRKRPASLEEPAIPT